MGALYIYADNAHYITRLYRYAQRLYIYILKRGIECVCFGAFRRLFIFHALVYTCMYSERKRALFATRESSFECGAVYIYIYNIDRRNCFGWKNWPVRELYIILRALTLRYIYFCVC